MNEEHAFNLGLPDNLGNLLKKMKICNHCYIFICAMLKCIEFK